MYLQVNPSVSWAQYLMYILYIYIYVCVCVCVCVCVSGSCCYFLTRTVKDFGLCFRLLGKGLAEEMGYPEEIPLPLGNKESQGVEKMKRVCVYEICM